MVVRVRVNIGAGLVHVELRRRYPGTQDASGRNIPEVGREAAQGAAEIVERQPEVEQRAQDHVARGTRETIEIQRLRQPSTPSVLAEAVVLHVREDHVIEHVYPHQDARGRQPFGQPHIIFARLGIA